MGPKGGYTGDFYAWVITNKVVPAVYELLGHLEKGPLFQDDEAVIHRTLRKSKVREGNSSYRKEIQGK